MGITNAKDRVYGAAGQVPDYQVSSPIFNTNSLGGIELASTAQYYRTTTMVSRDTAEMSMTKFGSCFATSSAALILSGYGLSKPREQRRDDWRPTTFLSGWSRGGVVALSVPGVTKGLNLVMAITTKGHYEVTLSALVRIVRQGEGLSLEYHQYAALAHDVLDVPGRVKRLGVGLLK